MSETTLLWHDYETWGLNPRLDRPSQFAAIRTDTDLNQIGDPVEFFCKPALDFIPHPQSALITGLTPQVADEKGIVEAEFAAKLNEVFSVPGTCGVGYNSMRFDDEVTRFNLYRNFYDPYAREWQNGNSRWDILDLVRMCYALRPEGINWPMRDPENEPGVPSFRLVDLCKANNIEQENAHDALSDVQATLGLARLIRQVQPKLYEYYFEFRRKAKPAALLNLTEKPALLHISGMYPSIQGCIAPVMPLCAHPRNKNEIIVFDLRQNPFELFNQDAEEIGKYLFTRKDELPEGYERVALKGVHINKSPALSPMSTLTPEAAEKWNIDLKQIKENRDRVLYFDGLEAKIQKIYSSAGAARQHAKPDPDGALYSGFVDRAERKACDQILKRSPEQRVQEQPGFQDERLQTLYTRYLGRNWPELLNDEQRSVWRDYVSQKLLDGEHDCTLSLDQYFVAVSEIEVDNESQAEILAQLEAWVEQHYASLGTDPSDA